MKVEYGQVNKSEASKKTLKSSIHVKQSEKRTD